jgi:formylglycine-generating enzyme required for sulfatase activity
MSLARAAFAVARRLRTSRLVSGFGWLTTLWIVAALASAACSAQEGKVFQDCSECPQMVVIPSGSFMMGSSPDEIQRDLTKVSSYAGPLGILYLFGITDHQRAAGFMAYEQPKHSVTIAHAFAMGRYPVTREEFGIFVKETGYQTSPCWLPPTGRPKPPKRDLWTDPGYPQTDQDPVVCVAWDDAQAYLRWLNLKLHHDTGGPYRLPSEAEWEYAARGGTKSQYWWGDDVGKNHLACDGCNTWGPGPLFYMPLQSTVPVGTFPPNPFGLYEILGNSADIVEDCWHESYVGAPTDGSAWMSGICQRHTLRGGSWTGPAWAARTTTRSGQFASETASDEGFRVVKNIQ